MRAEQGEPLKWCQRIRSVFSVSGQRSGRRGEESAACLTQEMAVQEYWWTLGKRERERERSWSRRGSMAEPPAAEGHWGTLSTQGPQKHPQLSSTSANTARSEMCREGGRVREKEGERMKHKQCAKTNVSQAERRRGKGPREKNERTSCWECEYERQKWGNCTQKTL